MRRGESKKHINKNEGVSTYNDLTRNGTKIQNQIKKSARDNKK